MKDFAKHLFFCLCLVGLSLGSLGGCKKKPASVRPRKVQLKSEAQKKAEEEAIQRVKASKTAKGLTIGFFVDALMKATDEKTRAKMGYGYDIQSWSATCEMPPPREIVAKRPLTEEERRRVLAGLPLEPLADAGSKSENAKNKGKETFQKPDAGEKPDAGSMERPVGEKVMLDAGDGDAGEPKSRFVRCEVQVILGASKEKETGHLKALWLLGAKNLVPQNAVARMLMQEATKDDWKEAFPEGSSTEKLPESTDAGPIQRKPPSRRR